MFYGFDDIRRWCLYQLGISCFIIFLISSTLFLIKLCNKFESDHTEYINQFSMHLAYKKLGVHMCPCVNSLSADNLCEQFGQNIGP